MAVVYQIDRQFFFMKGRRLQVFAERVLRATKNNSNYTCPPELRYAVETCSQELKTVLLSKFIKQRERRPTIRKFETNLLNALEKLAAHIEENISCKSDAYTTGFHLHNDHKSNTRRQQRMGAKKSKLATST